MNNLSPGAQGVMQGMGFSRPDMTQWNNMLSNWRQQMQANNYSYNWYPQQPAQAPVAPAAPAAPRPARSKLAGVARRLRDR